MGSQKYVSLIESRFRKGHRWLPFVSEPRQKRCAPHGTANVQE